MKLIVGLGNPTPTHSNNRHNIGFMVIDILIKDCNANNISKKNFLGELYKSKDTLFLKPTTYMNLSGKSVQVVANFFKIKPEDILVIHDEIDLPFGAVRIKKGGGHGGHNGLKSIDNLITKEYNRLRLGVDKPEKREMVASYVLSNFNTDEQKVLNSFVEYGASVAKAWIDMLLEQLKSKYSKKDSIYLWIGYFFT